jgi:hypothetical protein
LGIAIHDLTIEAPRAQLRRLGRGLPGTWPQAVPRRLALRAALGQVPGIIDWIKTAQGVAAIVVTIFATMGRLVEPRPAGLVFSPELAPVHRRIEVARAIRPGHPAPGARPGLVARQSARGGWWSLSQWEGRYRNRGNSTGTTHSVRSEDIHLRLEAFP